MKFTAAIILFLSAPLHLFSQGTAHPSEMMPQASQGRLVRHDAFPSLLVEPRDVYVWLPPAYNPKEKYQVLYMHDGQMLFDSTTTWNKTEWGVDEVASQLIQNKSTRSFIVVGINNSGAGRHCDYFPQKPFESLTQEQQDTLYNTNRNTGHPLFSGKINSDHYLKFIVTELKPFIDKTYSTLSNQQNTFIAGSSMGGLISIYAICEYPQVFGGAACMSTHWPGIFTMLDNPIPDAFLAYLKRHLPDPKNHKIYFDYGTATLDALYPPLQAKVDALMKSRGFNSSNWMTKEFPGEDHSEKAWHKRLNIPCTFLLK